MPEGNVHQFSRAEAQLRRHDDAHRQAPLQDPGIAKVVEWYGLDLSADAVDPRLYASLAPRADPYLDDLSDPRLDALVLADVGDDVPMVAVGDGQNRVAGPHRLAGPGNVFSSPTEQTPYILAAYSDTACTTQEGGGRGRASGGRQFPPRPISARTP